MVDAGAAGRRDPRAKLSRDQVLAAAWRVLDEAGLAAFSMRRLADRLGVAPMTLYGYVRDRDALLDAVLDYGSDALVLADPAGGWRERLDALMALLHRQLVAHPFVIELRLRRPILNPGSMAFTEAGLRALAEGGFAPADAAAAFRALFIYTFGSAAFGMPADPEAVRRDARARVAALDPADYAAVTAAAPALVDTLAGEAQFRRGLDLMLDALAAEAVATPNNP